MCPTHQSHTFPFLFHSLSPSPPPLPPFLSPFLPYLSLSPSPPSPLSLSPLSLLQVNGQDVGSMKVPKVEEMVQQCSHITLTLQGKLAQNGTRGKDIHHSHNRHTQIWITVHKLLIGYSGLQLSSLHSFKTMRLLCPRSDSIIQHTRLVSYSVCRV